MTLDLAELKRKVDAGEAFDGPTVSALIARIEFLRSHVAELYAEIERLKGGKG